MADNVSPGEIQKARFLALILPAAEREQLERDYGVRPAALSAGFALFEFCLGLAIYPLGYPGYGGLFGWIVWHLNPITWLGLLMIGTALLRAVNYFANHDSFGEPLVWLFLRVYQRRGRAAEAKRLDEEHGPVRPDRIVREENDALVLLASREKPRWDEHATVRVEDEFYRITGTQRRSDGSYTVVAYTLEAQPESENFLELVHTDARLPSPRPPLPGAESGTRGTKA